MAISKILYMKDCGNGNSGKHLKQSIEYISDLEKTGNGQFIGGLNCQPEFAYEQMKETKKKFGKTDKRQGYHLIISFMEGETTPEQAFEIVGRIVKEYLGKEYEAIYTVHDNTDHIHGHIIFNSVSFLDGKKYRYEKGDWAKNIQPITNRICQEYGLSTIDIEEDRSKKTKSYSEWDDDKGGKFIFSKMIKRDMDACVMQAPTFESFLELLKDKGYEIKQNKYLAVRPPQLTRFRRTKSLGENYTEERLRERILSESLANYKAPSQRKQSKIVYCKVRRFRKAKLSGLQKRYFAKIYRIGKHKKGPYSQAFKYREEIRKFEKLQQQYLFLNRNDITNALELAGKQLFLTEKKKEVSSERNHIYKKRASFKPLFDKLNHIEELESAANSYLKGDDFFQEEYEQWKQLKEELKVEGYTTEELINLKAHFKAEIEVINKKDNAVKREFSIANALMREVGETSVEVPVTKEKISDITKEEKKR